MNLRSLIGRVSPGNAIRPTWVEVDLGAVYANAMALAQLTGTDIYAVLKADAYGHGAIEIAKTLSGDVSHFAVSLIEEGIELREAGITDPILVMGPAMHSGYSALAHYDMTAMISHLHDLDELAALSQPVQVHLKVDTGMGRLGFSLTEATQHVHRASGLATHFSSADTDDENDPNSTTNRQITAFRQFCARVDPEHTRVHHAANSGGILNYPSSWLDAVRPGLALYGNTAGPVRQVLRFCTRIAQLRDISPGTSVSYGGLWTARQPSRLAVVPVGYADGFPRALTGHADVLVRGKRCPVVGAISMDMSMVDVTSLADAAAVGDEVVLLGVQGDENISVIEFAERSGLLPYEVTCGISKRVPRTYLSN